MSNGGYLSSAEESPAQEELWTETWKRINRFQPNLFAELFPEEAGKPQKPKVSRDERREMDVAVRGKEGEGEGEGKEKDEVVDEKAVVAEEQA